MNIPVEQINEDDVIIRQQERDRQSHLDERRPASFDEYLASSGYSPKFDSRRPATRESLAQLAERAKRAPRV